MGVSTAKFTVTAPLRACMATHREGMHYIEDKIFTQQDVHGVSALWSSKSEQGRLKDTCASFCPNSSINSR